VGAIDVSRLSYRLPGGRTLLEDVSFSVGDGQHVALVGANGVGKTTLLRVLAGDDEPSGGTWRVDGRLGVMRQLVGTIRDATTVRDLLLSLSSFALRAAGDRLAATPPSDGMRYADALAAWGDAGGYEAEVLWDVCTSAALRQPFYVAGDRRLGELSGGEQKRLALEALFRSDFEVLILDEPDNFLDVPGKEWLERSIRSTPKTVLYVSHDRELLANTSQRVVTLEARGAWTHGSSFATWHEARQERLSRLDEEHRRFREERQRLETTLREFRRQAQMGSDKASSRLKATATKIRRLEADAPPELPKDRNITIRLGGDRTGKRAVTVEDLGFPGIVEPFDAEVLFGERIGVLGLNGTGKSHFLQLLAGGEVDHTGRWQLGARVVPGYFSQTHDHPELLGRRLVDVLTANGASRGQAMASLRRYDLHSAADQPFETLSGGQQARFQVLLLELGGSTLLLLDEPTDNLDVASAEALEEALAGFTGTVLAVTHDRWFMRSFDRFLVFGRDGRVTEELSPSWA
jgi:ATPase subunit of ABC transporter with duplicated ATPase domains